jgi:3-oxoacyl-[acyl-carrier protein] reductase
MSSVGIAPGSELIGKVALVTGGSRNIGRAISRSLAAGGAAVMVNTHTSLDDARETVRLIEQAGSNAAMFVADVTDVIAVARLVDETVKRFGRLDILVNNAAVRRETDFDRITLEEWRRVLSVILDGAFICAQAVLPHLIQAGGGTIINMGGQTGHKGANRRLHVVAAKGGLAAMTKGLALDLAPHDITVNCVVPGGVDTVRGSASAPERPEYRRSLPPLGRRGEPGEVAAMVRLLCGPDGRFVTGQSIHLNGGGFMP